MILNFDFLHWIYSYDFLSLCNHALGNFILSKFSYAKEYFKSMSKFNYVCITINILSEQVQFRQSLDVCYKYFIVIVSKTVKKLSSFGYHNGSYSKKPIYNLLYKLMPTKQMFINLARK